MIVITMELVMEEMGGRIGGTEGWKKLVEEMLTGPVKPREAHY